MRLYKIVKQDKAALYAEFGLGLTPVNGTEMAVLSSNPTAIPQLTPSGFGPRDHAAVFYSTLPESDETQGSGTANYWYRVTFLLPDWEVEEWLPWAEAVYEEQWLEGFGKSVGGHEFLEQLRFTRVPVQPSQLVSIERLDNPQLWTDVTAIMSHRSGHSAPPLVQ